MSVIQNLNDITDIFTGADGGVGYALSREKLIAIEKQANSGDKSAIELINIVNRFTRLMTNLSKS
jgi:hypothetical protein